MSEQAPEGGGRRRENAFTRRIGPLPMWQWFLIALAMIGVYVIFSYRKKNQAAASAANQAGGTATGGTAGAGQVPQFVNQTYTYVAPPAAQPPPPSSHPGGIGQGGGGLRPGGGTLPAQPGGLSPLSGSTLASATGGSPPNVTGMSLAAAIQAIQKAGWSVTSVTSARNPYQAVSASANGGATVISSVPHLAGLAGQYQARSVSLAIP